MYNDEVWGMGAVLFFSALFLFFVGTMFWRMKEEEVAKLFFGAMGVIIFVTVAHLILALFFHMGVLIKHAIM